MRIAEEFCLLFFLLLSPNKKALAKEINNTHCSFDFPEYATSRKASSSIVDVSLVIVVGNNPFRLLGSFAEYSPFPRLISHDKRKRKKEKYPTL